MQETPKVKTTIIKNVHSNKLSDATKEQILKHSADEIFDDQVVRQVMAELAKM
ncbi:hypothetical protein LDJ81_09225 [Lentilactobacillus parabuchneri]|uniref:hypothetical protein n=1 Tax=Lentilactobacillus parabuchneri TaxID=152331 RepID=UPI002235CEE9|nr:hypothetical protein [Lentilactobacillus parabuchneri]MCW4399182.1 hypothetical protein [Lentilactobacillus parabuchneri]